MLLEVPGHCLTHCVHFRADHSLDVLLVDLAGAVGHLYEHLVLTVLRQGQELAVQVFCMCTHSLTPVRPFQDQPLGLSRVALHVGFDELLQDLAYLLSHFIDRLLAKHSYIVLDLIISVLTDEFKLSVEAVIELLMQCLKQL